MQSFKAEALALSGCVDDLESLVSVLGDSGAETGIEASRLIEGTLEDLKEALKLLYG